jgi:alkylation response protein AidB-like acyl-CoA dehydrogenase
MDFGFNEEQEMWRHMCQDFTEKEAGKEYSRECDLECKYPWDLWEAGIKQGFLGLLIPEEYGGMGSDPIMYCIFAECLSKYSYEMASIFSVPMFCAMNLVEHGTKEQKDRYLPGFVTGDIRFSVSITETEAGSDAANIQTQCVDKGDHWLLNGQKMFATGAHIENNIIMMGVRTDKDAVPKHRGISVVMVPNDTPGVDCVRLPLITRRAVGTCEVFMNDAKVPKDMILGEVNKGWRLLTGHLELERAATAAALLGEAQNTLDEAIEYSKTRIQFGQPICKNQAISFRLAELQAKLDACRLLTYRSAWMVQEGKPCLKEVAMAKLRTADVFYEIATAAMQTWGGACFLPESDVERHWRMAKLQQIGGGSSEIQKLILARQLGM